MELDVSAPRPTAHSPTRWQLIGFVKTTAQRVLEKQFRGIQISERLTLAVPAVRNLLAKSEALLGLDLDLNEGALFLHS